jgi:hypothetical protein
MNSLVRRSPRLVAQRRYATLVPADQRGNSNKETLVVVGGGWAGYNFVRKLDKVSSQFRRPTPANPSPVPLQPHLHQRQHQLCHHSAPAQLGVRLPWIPRHRRTPPVHLGALLSPLVGRTCRFRQPDRHLSPRIESRIPRQGSARQGTAARCASRDAGKAQGDVQNPLRQARHCRWKLQSDVQHAGRREECLVSSLAHSRDTCLTPVQLSKRHRRRLSYPLSDLRTAGYRDMAIVSISTPFPCSLLISFSQTQRRGP